MPNPDPSRWNNDAFSRPTGISLDAGALTHAEIEGLATEITNAGADPNTLYLSPEQVEACVDILARYDAGELAHDDLLHVLAARWRSYLREHYTEMEIRQMYGPAAHLVLEEAESEA